MPKQIPLRKCVACRERKEKRDLIRVVNDPEKGPIVDTTGKANGRGAYLCRDVKCIQTARKKNMLKFALKTSIPEDFYEEILRHVEP